jgi:hypothetical protein
MGIADYAEFEQCVEPTYESGLDDSEAAMSEAIAAAAARASQNTQPTVTNTQPTTQNTLGTTMNIVPVQNTTVAVPQAPSFAMAFAEKQNAYSPRDMELLGPSCGRVTAEQNNLMLNRKELLGQWLKFDLASINSRWAIVPGSNDKEAAGFFRVSYDGQTVAGENVTVTEYVEHLKSLGYTKAASVPYIDLLGFITESEKGIVVTDQLCIVQLPKTAAGAWINFSAVMSSQIKKGGQLPDLIGIKTAFKQGKSGNYTSVTFFPAKTEAGL